MSVASAKTAAHSIRLMEPFTIFLQALIALNMATAPVVLPQILLSALTLGLLMAIVANALIAALDKFFVTPMLR